ncbi:MULTISPECIES: fibronectin type III domain-containing protein [unclassified Streptomyces]|uniref:fibronectin type III domain-containing protein n=1 Tax=unclassified Streptomyces TaxID=2593676 RepID=UPI00278C4F29|nr:MULTISPECIES: fibronectin type III domain-containing protein [unclassified Streptomyces]
MRRLPPRTLLPRAACAAALVASLTSCGLLSDDANAQGPALSAPVGVTAQAGSATSVHVMWNRPASTAELKGYEVYRGGKRVERLTAEQHMVDVTGLAPKSRYVFTVRARGKDGSLGPVSTRVTVTTPAAVKADHAAPSRPTGLRGQADGGRAVSLSWRKATDDRGVASYDIYQGGAKIHSVGGKETRALLTGLRPGTAYAFSVRARDAADNTSAASETLHLTTAKGGGEEGPGTAPSDFEASTRRAGGAFYIDLAWTPPRTGGEVPAYQVYLDGREATTVVWGESAPAGSATYSFYIGKKARVEHRVRIRAQLPDGTWGAFSKERKVTTGDGRAGQRG